MTKKLILNLFVVLLFVFPACDAQHSNPNVKVGAEILIEDYLPELEGKRVGLIMNPTSRIANTHMLDTLLASGVNVTALFAPEHGFRGDRGAGEEIENGTDLATGLPVFSLYGSQKKPTPRMLDTVDLLIFDMQDVGARFYTYISTMKYALEAAAESGKEIWILDRPNPAGGEYVSGWVLEEEYESFVGMYPIPVAHGLTMGELALMAVGEGWLSGSEAPAVKVVEMEGWRRSMRWPETGLEWIPPSPNLPDFEHAYVYLGACFFEGTPFSEGRGTDAPFLKIGHPELDPDKLDLSGLEEKYQVQLRPARFTPRAIPGKALNPKNKDQVNLGVELTAYQSSGALLRDPVRLGVELMKQMMEAKPSLNYDDYIFLLAGSKQILEEEIPDWTDEVAGFRKQREKYLLYE